MPILVFSLKFVKNLIFSEICALYVQNDLLIQKVDKTTQWKKNAQFLHIFKIAINWFKLYDNL